MSETQNDGIKQDEVYRIEDAVTNAWKRIKRFANEHPTVSASVVTGVISWKMGKRHTIKKTTGEVTKLVEMLYELGNEAGMLQTQRDILLDFIAEKNLKSEAAEFASNLR